MGHDDILFVTGISKMYDLLLLVPGLWVDGMHEIMLIDLTLHVYIHLVSLIYMPVYSSPETAGPSVSRP